MHGLRSFLKRPAPRRAGRRARAGQVSSFTASQLKKVYGIPGTGQGQTVAIIELGGKLNQADLNTSFASQGLTVKAAQTINIDGATQVSSGASGADGEVMLDAEVIGGVAPGAQMVVLFAPNTTQGFEDAVTAAIKLKPCAISISWGEAEKSWAASDLTKFNAIFATAKAAGIVVCAAAGDNGSGDGLPGQNVDFPASSPNVLGCGGTTIVSISPLQQTVWNDGSSGGATGGGVSQVFPLPAFQAKANVPGGKMRGVPDVACDADPESGYNVVVDGQAMVIGGTSAAAPFWAAIVACYTQLYGPLTNFIERLYAAGTCGSDITVGNNGTYVARAGYDCTTGLGTPLGSTLTAIFGAPQTTVPTPTPPTPAPAPAPAPVHPTPPPPAPHPAPPARPPPPTHVHGGAATHPEPTKGTVVTTQTKTITITGQNLSVSVV